MKKLQKILAIIMIFSLVLSFAACGKNDAATLASNGEQEKPSTGDVSDSSTEPTTESTTEPSTESTTESTTAAKKESTTKAKPSQTQKPTEGISTTKPSTVQPPQGNAAIVGKWSGNYQIPAEYIYDGFLTVGEHTPLKLRATYVFNADGTCSTNSTILNSKEFGDTIKRDLIDGFEVRTGTPPTDQDIADINNSVDAFLTELNNELQVAETATYKVDGNKIVYTADGVSFYETFTLNGNTLTLTGCSIPDANIGYPVTLYKV